MDNGNFAKFSASLGFALKVVKHQNDAELADVIKEQERTDTETADFISALNIRKYFRKEIPMRLI